MQQHNLRPQKGSNRSRKRIGRGDGSGYGSMSGRGMKGQKSRSGGGVRLGFEGGQLSLIKKLPMVRGFTNIFRKEYKEVNLDWLARFPANSEITPQTLVDRGFAKNLGKPVKVLGRGELDVPLTVEAHKFSRSAREKIEAAGGSVRVIG
ncbi:MAG: 50S ribosomal protein L15 [Dehalococcoidia bacterium]|nr:50S ribosomal protein L15 [Dehalococcoidia bacterium]